MEPAFAYEGIHLTTHVQGQAPMDPTEQAKDPDQFVREADYFAQCVFENKEPKTDGEEGLRDMKYMDDIYRSCGRTMR